MADSIGSRIKRRREELKMSQDELAVLLGYKSRSSITKIEKDGRELPQKKIADIAKALKTSPSYIMGWDDVETQKKNDIAADIAVRLSTDDEFLSVVSILAEFDSDKLQKARQILHIL